MRLIIFEELAVKMNNLTRQGGLQSGVPLCPDIIPLGVEAAGLEESRRWTGMNTYGEARRIFT